MDIRTNCRSRILAFCVLFLAFAEAAEWKYSGEHGPQNWHKLFPKACSGKAQSPINIRPEQTLYNPNLRDFAIWHDPPKPGSRMMVVNNGHAVQVNLKGDFFVTNAGLPNVYKSVQFHFHWGHADHHGSEHTVDSIASPLEMHIVNYNHDKYSTIAEAVIEPEGLAVLGVLFEISDKDNKEFEPLVQAMEHIKDPDNEPFAHEIKPISLRSLLPKDITRYYRYNGSLTTPGCFESVVWTVFDQRQTISARQMAKFREVLQHKRHKHKHGKHGHHARSRKVRRAENQAQKALDELGIRGNEMEEAELKMEMMVAKMANDTNKEPTHSHKMSGELDEDAAQRAEKNMMDHYKDKMDESTEKIPATDKAHSLVDTAHNKETQDEDLEKAMEYIQEKLVNNFRPVQPLNGRLIYRSFKLRSAVIVNIEDGPETEVQYTAGNPSGDPNGSSHLTISFTTLAISISLISKSIFL